MSITSYESESRRPPLAVDDVVVSLDEIDAVSLVSKISCAVLSC